MELFKTVPVYSWLFSQILKFMYYSIKPIEKLSRRHLINSSDDSSLMVSLYQKRNKREDLCSGGEDDI